MEGKQNSRPVLLFLRPVLFSLAMVIGTAVISAGLYLGLPPSLGFAGTGLGGLFLLVPLLLVYRAWGWGSRRAEVAVWLAGLLSVLGTIALEAGVCQVLLRGGLSGPSWATYVQCSVNYLRGSRFGHVLWGFLSTLVLWADIRYANWTRRRGRTKMVVAIIAWHGKAYLPCYGRVKPDFYREIGPVYVVDINEGELLPALQKVLAAGLPHISGSRTREEADRLERGASTLEVTKARSWKELAKAGAAYVILGSDKEIRVEMSRLDRKGWWEFDPEKRRIFPPDAPLEEIVAVILEDIRSRPEVWE